MPPRPTLAELDAWLRRFFTAWPGTGAADRLGREVTNWHAAFARAGRHGVLAILAAALERAGFTWPPDARQELDRRRTLERLWQTRLHRDLREAVDGLRARNIRTVVLKGPVLAERLYGDADARLSTDIDLLLSPDDLDAAAADLLARGYSLGDAPATARYLRRWHHHWSFVRPGHPRVELHFRGHAGFGTLIESGEWLERAQPFTSKDGWSCPILSPEDEFVFLAVHAADHGFDRLLWLLDLKAFLGAHPELRWPLVWHRARESRVLRPVAVAVRMLRLLGVEVSAPTPWGQRWRTLAAVRSLFGDWATVPPWDTPIALIQQAVLCDTVGLASRHLAHHFGRMGRRRCSRAFPTLFPADWQG